MIVMAIDPGPEQSGWVRLCDGKLVGCGVDTTSAASAVSAELSACVPAGALQAWAV